jgi:HlyD family secretion protein
MRVAKGWILAIVFTIALLALIGWRVVTHKQDAAAAAGGGAGAGGGVSKAGGGGAGGRGKKPASVKVTAAKSADIINTVQVVGNVESPQSVDISAKITGRINLLQVREGDPVKVGQVLVKIDPSDLNQQLLQQQANVAEAKSKLAQAMLTQGSNNVGVTTNIQQQQAALNSAQADYKQTLGSYAAQVHTAQSSVASNEAKLRAANVQVQNAKAVLSQQQSSLANAKTKAQRLQSLFSQGAISQQDRDDAATAVDVQTQNVGVAQGQVAAAEANVQSAQADLSSAKDQLGIVKQQGTANIAASKAKTQQAQASLQSANANKSQAPAYQANIDALKAGVAAAQAQYEASKVHLLDTTLISPIDGAVTARAADPGDLASPGKSILTVQSLDWVYVSTAVPVESSAGLREGMNAQVTFDTLPGQVFTGPITNLNPTADPQSRQFSVRIRLENPGRLLKPGMYARVGIVTSSVHAKVSVPIEAVTTGDKGSTVTVVDKDSIAHVVPVTLGATDGKFDEVKGDIKPGDQVVILSYSPVKDGQAVTMPGADGQSSGGQRGGSGTGASGTSSKGARRRNRQS